MVTKYDEEFFSGHGPLSLSSALAVLPIVSELVSVKSVCDVGCGVGTWLSVWKTLGVEDIYGIDGRLRHTGAVADRSSSFSPSRPYAAYFLRPPVRSRDVHGGG